MIVPFQAPSTDGKEGGSKILDRVLAMLETSIGSLRRAVTNDKLVRIALDNSRDWPVTHGLGHAVQTWEIVDRNANATVWQPATRNATPASSILLRSSAAVSVLVRFT